MRFAGGARAEEDVAAVAAAAASRFLLSSSSAAAVGTSSLFLLSFSSSAARCRALTATATLPSVAAIAASESWLTGFFAASPIPSLESGSCPERRSKPKTRSAPRRTRP